MIRKTILILLLLILTVTLYFGFDAGYQSPRLPKEEVAALEAQTSVSAAVYRCSIAAVLCKGAYVVWENGHVDRITECTECSRDELSLHVVTHLRENNALRDGIAAIVFSDNERPYRRLDDFYAKRYS